MLKLTKEEILIKLSSYIDTYKLNKKGTATLMELLSGFEDGFDMKPFINRPYTDLRTIKRGIKLEYYLTDFLNGIYNNYQMEEIFIGIESKIDISKYTKPEL